jgi:hypothetical protein
MQQLQEARVQRGTGIEMREQRFSREVTLQNAKTFNVYLIFANLKSLLFFFTPHPSLAKERY